MNYLYPVAIATALLTVSPAGLQAKKKKDIKGLAALVKTDSLSDYKKVTKDAKVKRGLFNVWLNYILKFPTLHCPRHICFPAA